MGLNLQLSRVRTTTALRVSKYLFTFANILCIYKLFEAYKVGRVVSLEKYCNGFETPPLRQLLACERNTPIYKYINKICDEMP